jgi:UDP-glucose 4-epimerase
VKKTKSLVTGGAGFIGSHMVEKLLNAGHDVIAVDDESSSANAEFYWRDDAENHKVDICDASALTPLFKEVDYVFHFAARSRIQICVEDPPDAVKNNTLGTCNVLQAARIHQCKRVMMASTSSCYGLANPIPLKEDMPNDCLNPYSVSKAACEELCKMYSKLFGVETVIFRFFNVYGERQPVSGSYAPVVGLFFRQKEKGEDMTVVGDGLQTRDYTHVTDIVEALFLASESKNKAIIGKLFNLGTGRNHSIMDIVALVGGPHVHIPERPGEARETLAENSRAKDVLKWNPSVVFEDWVKANRPK